MSKVQVVVDGGMDVRSDDGHDGPGVGTADPVRCVATLLRQVESVHLINTSPTSARLLKERFGSAIHTETPSLSGLPLLVTSGRVAFAWGSVHRLRQQSEIPGRCVTRVLLPGPDGGELTRCWSRQWLASFEGELGDLLRADLSFDREHLPHSSPTARAWVRGDELGLALTADVGDNLIAWHRRVGVHLGASRWWSNHIRARAGVARRHMARRRQRNQQI